LKKRLARARSAEDQTYFLNVDLDFVQSSLEPLAAALVPKCLSSVSQLYVGQHGNRYGAHFESRASPRAGADSLLLSMVRLVKDYRGAPEWSGIAAYRRDFNIGIPGGLNHAAVS
jgi:hypothetical protein